MRGLLLRRPLLRGDAILFILQQLERDGVGVEGDNGNRMRRTIRLGAQLTIPQPRQSAGEPTGFENWVEPDGDVRQD